MIKRYLMVGALVASLGVWSGCTYTTKTLLPSHIKSIAIDNFKNKIDLLNEQISRREYKIYRTGLELKITQAVTTRFNYEGTLNLVARENADAILEGELIDYNRQPIRYSVDEEIELYRVSITVRIRFKDVRDNTILFEREVVGDSDQFVVGRFASTEEDALNKAVDDVAQRVVEETIEYGW